MKKLVILLILAISLGAGMIGAMPAPSQAQFSPPPPPPQQALATPYIGANTPWVYYRGDWFLNGVLYYFFGNQHGWAPYYSYPQTYVVRPGHWYGPKWEGWYRSNPVYWQNFQQRYPHWRDHQVGRQYGKDFYERYHHGQGGGWQHWGPGQAPGHP